MKFITIQNQVGETVAINPKRITSIATAHGSVVICLGAQEFVFTRFTDLKAAVDYVEKAWWDRENDGKSIKWDSDP